MPAQQRASSVVHISNRTEYQRQNGDAVPPTLSGISRDGFVQLIRRINKDLPCPVGAAAMNTFALMVSVTRISDWTTPGEKPVCYMAQTRIAELAGCTAGRIRAHEAELEKAGLIEKHTLGNGGRSGWRDRGIFFTPAIKRLEEFLTLRALQEERNQAAGRLRGKRSTFKRVLKSVVADLATYLGVEHAEVKRFSVALRALPRADRLHHMSLQALAIHIDELDRLCGDAVDMLRKQEESHGQPPEIERSHIQDTNIIPDSVICNTRLHEKPADRSADINRSDTSSLSDANCLESNHEAERAAHKSEFLEKLGPERLYALASSEMQIHLDVRKFRSGSLNFLDFAIAAQNRLPELGIDHSAWTQAVRQMGEDTATMCVLILDASRDRPGLPVANPGGYLRGMTRAAQVGKLNIIGGLVGLSERKKG